MPAAPPALSLLVPAAEGPLQAAPARRPPREAGEAGGARGTVMGETLTCQFGLCQPGDLGFPPAFFSFGLGLSVYCISRFVSVILMIALVSVAVSAGQVSRGSPFREFRG